MNIAKMMIPKACTVCLQADDSVRQGLELLRNHGYTAIPLISRDDRYVGTLSEGDLLWHLVENPENYGVAPVGDIMRGRPNHPVAIAATIDQLIHRAENQNFVPVVDDRGTFIGIVTRKDIILHYTGGDKDKGTQKTL